MWYFVYLLLSLKDHGTYPGQTNDLKNRFKKHNQGKVDATQDRRPLRLIYFEAYRSRKEAMKREKYLKTGHGRRYLRKVVKNYWESNSKN